MRLPAFLRAVAVRPKQRSLLRAIDSSPVRYSNRPGIFLQDPAVITGAELDVMGTMAILAWLIKKRGTMGIDWQTLVKSGHHDGHKNIDIHEIQSRSGIRETFYLDITESYGRWPGRDPA